MQMCDEVHIYMYSHVCMGVRKKERDREKREIQAGAYMYTCTVHGTCRQTDRHLSLTPNHKQQSEEHNPISSTHMYINGFHIPRDRAGE